MNKINRKKFKIGNKVFFTHYAGGKNSLRFWYNIYYVIKIDGPNSSNIVNDRGHHFYPYNQQLTLIIDLF